MPLRKARERDSGERAVLVGDGPAEFDHADSNTTSIVDATRIDGINAATALVPSSVRCASRRSQPGRAARAQSPARVHEPLHEIRTRHGLGDPEALREVAAELGESA